MQNHADAAAANSLRELWEKSSIVVMPDVRGLHSFYKELAERFAEAGIDAVAIDYFGRTAGDGPRDEGFEYQGRPYKSLSAVARTITGTRWNGLVFFGLKGQRSQLR